MTLRLTHALSALLFASAALGACNQSTPPMGTAIDTFDIGNGMVTSAPVPASRWATLGALVQPAGGAVTSYKGTLDGDGNIDIPGLPAGPYLLSLSEPIPAGSTQPSRLELHAMTSLPFSLGSDRSHRQGLMPLTKPSSFTVNAALTIPWQTVTFDDMGNVTQPNDDVLDLFSRGTAVEGEYFASAGLPDEGSPPADKATTISGWTVNASTVASYSEDGASQYLEDDVTLIHEVAGAIDNPALPAGSSWAGMSYTAAREALHLATISLADGATSTLSGNFQPLPAKTFSLDYKGSAFAALLADAPDPNTFLTSASIAVLNEPGTPKPATGGVATLFSLFVTSRSVYADPHCNPEQCDATCDPNACAMAMATPASPDDYAHDFTYGNPFDYGQELLSVGVTFRTPVTHLLPDMTNERLAGSYFMTAPASDFNGKPLQPSLGLPRSLTVNGAATPLDKITSLASTTPTLGFQAPSLGQPDYYVVSAILLDDRKTAAGAATPRSTVYSLTTTATSVTLPAGVLQSGSNYFFQVSAVSAPGHDASSPLLHEPRETYAQTYTGIVSPH